MEPWGDGERSALKQPQQDSRPCGERQGRVVEQLEKLASSVERERARLLAEIDGLRKLLEDHSASGARLHDEMAAVVRENQRLSREYTELERHSAHLARLHVAGLQLHASPRREAVLAAIRDVVATLIGSEEIAVYALSRPDEQLVPIAAFGLEGTSLESVPVGSGVIGRAALTGVRYLGEAGADPDAGSDESGVSACIPLAVEGAVTGVIVLFRLLPHKLGFDESDHELLDHLSEHAAMALYCADLHALAASVSA